VKPNLSLVVAVLVGIGCAECLGDEDMIAIGRLRQVYTIDSATGSGSILHPGEPHSNEYGGMAKHSDGTLLAGYYRAVVTLQRIDPATGIATRDVESRVNEIAAMAFAPDGTCYAIQNYIQQSGCVLYRLNWPAYGSTIVGEIQNPYRGVQGMAIDSHGTAYIWDIWVGLATIDLTTAVATDVSGQWGGTNEIMCLAFDENDNLYGACNALYRINTADGSYEIIGSGGYSDVRGIEFDPGGGYRLRIRGECPGTVSLAWSGATPSRQQGLVFGVQTGSTTIPGGVCQGTVLGISGGVRLINTFGTGNGSGTVFGEAGSGACGGFLQLVEAPSCNVSNPFQIR